MARPVLFLIPFLAVPGCTTHHYKIVGESDTSKPIAVTIVKTAHRAGPAQLYYTELTGNDTQFIFDEAVEDGDARVEAWFALRDHPDQRTVYTIPPGRDVYLKLDDKHESVVIEETKFDNGKHHSEHHDHR